jgi:hypothetical protein
MLPETVEGAMAITLEAAFRRARARMPRRRGGIYDPGILVRLDFAVFEMLVSTLPGTPAHQVPPAARFGVSADDLRSIWEFWPTDRQADWHSGEVPPGAGDMLVSALRSTRTGLGRDGAFLGQFRILERPGAPFLFQPTHPTLAAFASPLAWEAGSRSYRIERTITAEDVKAVWPTRWEPANPPVFWTGWISLRFQVLGVAYVA